MENTLTFDNPFSKHSKLTLSPEDCEAVNKGEVVEINGEKGTEDEDSVYTVIDFKTFVKLIVRSLDFGSMEDVLCFPWFHALRNYKNWSEEAAENFVDHVLPHLDYCDAENLAYSIFDVYDVIEDAMEGDAFDSFFDHDVSRNIKNEFIGFKRDSYFCNEYFDIIVYNGEAGELGLKLD